MAIAEVVKFNGAPDIFAWKFPNEELGTWTQLIVNESQEAVLFKSGKALYVMGSGRHTLDTANIPILSGLINLPFGGHSPFTAEIWYVNRLHSLDIKWGTSTPIQIQDPKYGLFVPVRSFGQFGIKIEDSRKFLTTLVGTLPVFDKQTLVRYFRGLYVTKVKDSISTYLVRKQISILEINAYLEEMSVFMKDRIAPTLQEYGISLVNFYVNDVSVPEDDPTVAKLKGALAKKAEMNIIGYSYQQERSFNTLEGAATNPGSSATAFVGAGLGLGMGAGMGGEVGRQFGSVAGVMGTSDTRECPKCSNIVEKSRRFCGSCGYDSLEEVKAETIICVECGAKLNPTVKFCPQCGGKYVPCPECKADVPEGAVQCPVCHAALPFPCPNCAHLVSVKNSRFCPECGVSLVKKCPGCMSPLEGSPNFCPGCGEKLKG